MTHMISLFAFLRPNVRALAGKYKVSPDDYYLEVDEQEGVISLTVYGYRGKIVNRNDATNAGLSAALGVLCRDRLHEVFKRGTKAIN